MPNKKPNPYDINKIFEQMTLDLIDSLKRNFYGHKVDEMKEGFRWEMWQSAKLRALNEYKRRNKKIVNHSTRKAMRLVDDVLNDSYQTGQTRFESLLQRFIRFVLKPFQKQKEMKGSKAPRVELPKDFHPRMHNIHYESLPKAPLEKSFFKINDRKLEALQKSVKSDLDKVQNSVLRHMDDVYRQVIFKANVNLTAGSKTLDQAIDMATKDFLSKGINVIEYSDGRKVSIGAYAEMALRTASQRATFMGEGKKRDELGVYTVLMSAHANCSPMCLLYQGTVMIDDVYTSLTKEKALELSKETKYGLLSEAMENHAFHPNCRHSLATFFPGVNSIPDPVDDEQALARYEAEQKQRYMERNIKKYKRLAEGSLDEVNQRRYNNKVKEWQGRLREHIEQNNYLKRNRKKENMNSA